MTRSARVSSIRRAAPRGRAVKKEAVEAGRYASALCEEEGPIRRSPHRRAGARATLKLWLVGFLGVVLFIGVLGFVAGVIRTLRDEARRS